LSFNLQVLTKKRVNTAIVWPVFTRFYVLFYRVTPGQHRLSATHGDALYDYRLTVVTDYRPSAAIVAAVALLSSDDGRRFKPTPVKPLKMEKTGDKRLKKQNGR
jgi:hypothetical protein